MTLEPILLIILEAILEVETATNNLAEVIFQIQREETTPHLQEEIQQPLL
jgi:hypothetical protein